jgi:DNA-directed RNA polymerase specialized sigma24 family protein
VPISPELINRLAEVAEEMDFGGLREARARCLNECVDALLPESRRMILMRYSDAGHSVEDIAKTVNRTVQATYALLKRIRAVLRKCVTAKLAEA